MYTVKQLQVLVVVTIMYMELQLARAWRPRLYNVERYIVDTALWRGRSDMYRSIIRILLAAVEETAVSKRSYLQQGLQNKLRRELNKARQVYLMNGLLM
ncbi:hypothetical protein D3C76_1499330 [compost metagenome]